MMKVKVAFIDCFVLFSLCFSNFLVITQGLMEQILDYLMSRACSAPEEHTFSILLENVEYNIENIGNVNFIYSINANFSPFWN